MRSYRVFNLTAAGLAIYFLLLPLISPVMEDLLPDLWRCRHRASTGRDCPICGVTGDMTTLFTRGATAAGIRNPLSLPLMTLILLEFVFRIGTLVFIRESRIWIGFDIVVHSVLLLLFLLLFLDEFIL